MTATEVASGSQPNTNEPSTSSGNNQLIQTTAEDDNTEWTCHLKWIPWNSGRIPIVMQSRNGPCPLIATINVLLLREKLKLPNMLEQITAAQLLTYLGECIMDSVPTDLQNEEVLNIQQNIHDAIEILPKLKTGLDVNIRFTGITDFEYTPECIIFDLLRIPLYHGWLIDPNFSELKRAIGSQSYNQLVDNIITNKSSTEPEAMATVLLAEEFLEQTASQLTVHGLQELKSKIKDNEIGILFRNNHFLTLFKRESELYTLVTDHGYLTEDNIIWETLDNIEGAGKFYDANFLDSEVTNRQVSELKSIDQRQQQLENDFLVALSLSNEENNQSPMRDPGNIAEDDFRLAKFLQSQEDELVNARATNTSQTEVSHGSEWVSAGTNLINQERYRHETRQRDQVRPRSSASSSVSPIQVALNSESVGLNSTDHNQAPESQHQLVSDTHTCDTIPTTTTSQMVPSTSTTTDMARGSIASPSDQIAPLPFSETVANPFPSHQQQPPAAVASSTPTTTNQPGQRPNSYSSTSQASNTTTRRQRSEKHVKETTCRVH